MTAIMWPKKVALVTGVTGQDGYYMAEYLAGLDYRVYGTKRPGSQGVAPECLYELLECDITDNGSVARTMGYSNPDEVYNFAAQSHVGVSFNQPAYTLNVNVLGFANILNISHKFGQPRIFQASSSEMFGELVAGPGADENTPRRPVSPYGASKVAAHNLAHVYRLQGLFVACGISFNHESPRRGPNFVTQKICRAVAAYKRGEIGHIELGNMDAVRDWGDAREYVQAMHKILTAHRPDDYVIATGETASVSDWLAECCEIAGVDRIPVQVKEIEKRPNDINWLRGNASKLHNMRGVGPFSGWKAVCRSMMEAVLA